MQPTPDVNGVVVSSQQSDRLLTLLLRLGFTASRIGPRQLQIDDSTVDEVRRFALFFDIPALPASESSPTAHSKVH